MKKLTLIFLLISSMSFAQIEKRGYLNEVDTAHKGYWKVVASSVDRGATLKEEGNRLFCVVNNNGIVFNDGKNTNVLIDQIEIVFDKESNMGFHIWYFKNNVFWAISQNKKDFRYFLIQFFENGKEYRRAVVFVSK